MFGAWVVLKARDAHGSLYHHQPNRHATYKEKIRKQNNDAGDGHDIARHMLGQTVAAAMARDDFE